MSRLEKWLGSLVLSLVVVCAVLLFMQVDDGGMLLPDDPGTVAILMMAFVAITAIGAETIRSGNYAEGYIKLIDRLTSDIELQEAIELEYLAMPPGLPKKAIVAFADIAGALVKLTPTERDDKLAGWLKDALDGKVEMPE